MLPRPVVAERRFPFNLRRSSDFPAFPGIMLASGVTISHAKREEHEEFAFCVWLLRDRLLVWHRSPNGPVSAEGGSA
jgi:hypothetical protein